MADDEPLTRWALGQTLAWRGVGTTAVASREETCKALFRGRFDIVLIATQLGHTDMTDVVRQLAAGGGVHVVALCSDDQRASLAQWLPAAQILEKPFSIERLIEALPVPASTELAT